MSKTYRLELNHTQLVALQYVLGHLGSDGKSEWNNELQLLSWRIERAHKLSFVEARGIMALEGVSLVHDGHDCLRFTAGGD